MTSRCLKQLITMLLLMKSLPSMNCNELLLLDYQKVEYDDLAQKLQLGITYKGNCELLVVELFQKNGSSVVKLNDTTLEFPLPCDKVTISATHLDEDEIYFQLAAKVSTHNRTVCSKSLHKYFKILAQGHTTDTAQIAEDDIFIRVPGDLCTPMMMIFPDPKNVGISRYCPLVRQTDFSRCTDVFAGPGRIKMVNEDTIGFFDVRTYYRNDMLVHFECTTEVNSQYFQLIVASHQLISVPRAHSTTHQEPETTTMTTSSTPLSDMETDILISLGGVIGGLLVLCVVFLVLCIGCCVGIRYRCSRNPKYARVDV